MCVYRNFLKILIEVKDKILSLGTYGCPPT